MIALVLGLGFGSGCKPKKPDGTSPPGEEDEGGGGKRRGRRGRGGDESGGDEGGGGGKAADPDAASPDCPAEVSDTPTSLFQSTLFIRTPKNVEIVEQSPFFASTMSDFVSTCDAMVDRMAIIVLEDTDKTEDLLAKTKTVFEKNGFTGGKFSKPEIQNDTEVRVVAHFPPAKDSEEAKVYSVIQRKYGKLFLIWYQTKPDQWPGLVATFRESANRLIVVPPEDPNAP
jgi:hypothetical protein